MQKSTVNKLIKVIQSSHSALQQILKYLEPIFNDFTITLHSSILENAEKAIGEAMINDCKNFDVVAR